MDDSEADHGLLRAQGCMEAEVRQDPSRNRGIPRDADGIIAVRHTFVEEEAVIVRARGRNHLAGWVDELKIEALEAETTVLDDRAFDVATRPISTSAGTPGRGTTTCSAFFGTSMGSSRLVASIPTATGR